MMFINELDSQSDKQEHKEEKEDARKEQDEQGIYAKILKKKKKIFFFHIDPFNSLFVNYATFLMDLKYHDKLTQESIDGLKSNIKSLFNRDGYLA